MNFTLIFSIILSMIIFSLSLLFFLETYKNKNYKTKLKVNDRIDNKVAEEMAKKIISESNLHRKNRFSNDG